jgi:hypothetical protein
MRKSRVLLAGVAVAAAAAATSAFTAGNTVQDSVAGYGSALVTGATTAHINYQLNSTDKSVVDGIVFDLNENFDDAVANEGLEAWLQLQDDQGDPVGTPVQCTFAAFASAVTPVSCDITGTAITSFDGVALTVAE